MIPIRKALTLEVLCAYDHLLPSRLAERIREMDSENRLGGYCPIVLTGITANDFVGLPSNFRIDSNLSEDNLNGILYIEFSSYFLDSVQTKIYYQCVRSVITDLTYKQTVLSAEVTYKLRVASGYIGIPYRNAPRA